MVARRTLKYTPYKKRTYKPSTRKYTGKRYMPTRAFRGEVNYVDSAADNAVCDTTGKIRLINTVAQGASVNERIGKKFYMTHATYRGSWGSNSATVASDSAAMLVYDKRPTGSLPAITDILVTANSRSFVNDDNAGRFQILKRWDRTLIGVSGANSASAHTFDGTCRLNKLVVNKAAGTGAIGDIEQGALYFVTVGNQAAGTSASVLTNTWRVHFKDI